MKLSREIFENRDVLTLLSGHIENYTSYAHTMGFLFFLYTKCVRQNSKEQKKRPIDCTNKIIRVVICVQCSNSPLVYLPSILNNLIKISLWKQHTVQHFLMSFLYENFVFFSSLPSLLINTASSFESMYSRKCQIGWKTYFGLRCVQCICE